MAFHWPKTLATLAGPSSSPILVPDPLGPPIEMSTKIMVRSRKEVTEPSPLPTLTSLESVVESGSGVGRQDDRGREAEQFASAVMMMPPPTKEVPNDHLLWDVELADNDDGNFKAHMLVQFGNLLTRQTRISSQIFYFSLKMQNLLGVQNAGNEGAAKILDFDLFS